MLKPTHWPPTRRDRSPIVQTRAVAALAAYRVFVGALPFQQTAVDPLIAKQLRGLSSSEVSRAAAIAGPAARTAALAAADKGAQSWAGFQPANASSPDGAYQFAPGQTVSIYPQLADAKLLKLDGGKDTGTGYARRELASVRPLNVSSPAFAAALAHVADVGAASSSTRTPYQTETALFWADGDGTPSVAGRYFQIATSLLPANATLQDTADLYARLGAAQSDASAVGWALKHGHLFWRPITAIRRGASGLPPNTTWDPLLKTPPHPEFPSGHSLTAAASAAVLEDYFGGDSVSFTTNTAAPGFRPRNYTSLLASVDEVGDSRVWGGVHYNESVLAGRDVGYKVGREVVRSLGAKSEAKGAAKPATAGRRLLA